MSASFYTFGRDDGPDGPSSTEELLEVLSDTFVQVSPDIEGAKDDARLFAPDGEFSIYRISVERVEG